MVIDVTAIVEVKFTVMLNDNALSGRDFDYALKAIKGQPSPATQEEILEAKTSRHCPRCNVSRWHTTTAGEWKGIEVSKESPHDKEGVGGAIGYCHNCRFSF